MSVTRDQVDTICASFPGAELALPPELVSWKVGGKMFACFGSLEAEIAVSVKTDSIETARMLIETTPAFKAPYFHASWVRLRFEDTDPDEARHRLTVSYDLVRKSLKKAVRDALQERGTA